MTTRPTLIIVRGIPGSGKSTFARCFARAGHDIAIFEADTYFEIDGVYRFDPSLLFEAHAACKKGVFSSLKSGKTTIVSNTSTTWKEISVYLDVARECGADVQLVEVIGDFGSVHGVPQEAIDRMRSRWLDKDGFFAKYADVYREAFDSKNYTIIDNR